MHEDKECGLLSWQAMFMGEVRGYQTRVCVRGGGGGGGVTCEKQIL